MFPGIVNVIVMWSQFTDLIKICLFINLGIIFLCVISLAAFAILRKRKGQPSDKGLDLMEKGIKPAGPGGVSAKSLTLDESEQQGTSSSEENDFNESYPVKEATFSPLPQALKGSMHVNTVQPNPNTYLQEWNTAGKGGRRDTNPVIEFCLENVFQSDGLQHSEMDEENSGFKITILKAVNLCLTKRTPSLTNVLMSNKPGAFVPEGVYARVYNKEWMKPGEVGNGNGKGLRSSLTFFQTSLIKRTDGRSVIFTENESFDLFTKDFPIRISVYEVDKHGVRSSLGHCVFDLNIEKDLCFKNKVILTRQLYPSVQQASNVYN